MKTQNQTNDKTKRSRNEVIISPGEPQRLLPLAVGLDEHGVADPGLSEVEVFPVFLLPVVVKFEPPAGARDSFCESYPV